jgi:cellulose synthase/poly-beta-1,6-N-acetylglucosamine synthase-like glycosyltransferase
MPGLVLFALIAGGIGLAVPSLYLLFLTVAGVARPPRAAKAETARTRFAVLVPAHNEEELLPSLLRSLQRNDYPREMFDVYVVADNCTDGTADVGRNLGAVVFERRDTSRLGKGYALQWLLRQIPVTGKRYDAFVFLDGDTEVTPNFLAALDARFQKGSQAVQSYYGVSNAFQTPVSSLRYIALVLKHKVRPSGRQALGLSTGIFGTGMAFTRHVMEACSWDAFSLAEDIEYFMKLTDLGVRVDFAPEATVWSDMPTSLQGARSQNLRWEKGRVHMAAKYGPRFVKEGLLEGDKVKLDAAIEQAIPPLSLLAAAAGLFFCVALLVKNVWVIGLALIGLGALFGHVFLGMRSARVPKRAYRMLVYAPLFILWKAPVYARALLPGKTQWVKTQRNS